VNGKSGAVHLTAADIPYSDAAGSPNVDELLLENANAIAAHVDRQDNPHAVTKEQVGLGSVNNTSDLDKPVSTATQTALNGKLDTTAVVAPSTSSTDAGKAADAKATGDALAGKLDTAGGTMTGTLTAPQVDAGSLSTGELHIDPEGGGTPIVSGDYGYDLPAASGTLALTSQIPTAPSGIGCSVEAWEFDVDDGQGGTTTLTKQVVIGPAPNP